MALKPYYDDGNGIVIYHGDCREILPHLEPVDLVLTDPPYGIGYVHGAENIPHATKFQGVPVHGDDQPFDPSHLLKFPAAIMWGANHYANKLPGGGRWLVWDKRAGTKTYGKDMSDVELAWISGPRRADRLFAHLWDGFLRDSEKGVDRVHPTQKPVALMHWCLSFFPEAQTILDPYAGSFTTAVAAKALGRKCIAIEISEAYCEIGAKRLQAQSQPLPFTFTEKESHEQGQLLPDRQ